MKLKLALTVLFLMFVMIRVLHSKPESAPEQTQALTAATVSRIPAGNSFSQTPAAVAGRTPQSARAPFQNKEKASLQEMSRNLYQFTRPESRLVDLVSYLESNRQEPAITRNSNPDTGDMVIVRTRQPLAGTRYFHAQYFADSSGKSFAQHMSFEYKPSPTAFKEAIQSAKENFPELGEPKIRKLDYMQWSVGENHILWIKKLALSDLEDNPFNAYTPEDAGTIRVVYELEVHDLSHEHH